MTLHERLRQAIELLPPEVAVTLPVPLVRELLGSVAHSERVPDNERDLTVAEVAVRLRRPRSTVRAWLKAGRFEGAYKLSPRDWRVPVAAVTAFVDKRRPEPESEPALVRRRAKRANSDDAADLSAWRAR